MRLVNLACLAHDYVTHHQAQMLDGVELILPGGALLVRGQWPSQRGLRGDFVRHMALEIRKKDSGATIFIECSAVPIRIEAGAVDVLFITFQDVADRPPSMPSVSAMRCMVILMATT